MTWRQAVVVTHVQHHEDYNVKGDNNPPWTRTVRFDDGTETQFTWSALYRDCTHESNTRVGMIVFVSDRGGVSAYGPGESGLRRRKSSKDTDIE